MVKININIFLLIIFFTASVFSQESESITVIGDSLVGKRINGQQIREVIGNVIMTQEDVRITCDKAIQYITKNEAHLFGNVRAVQDTILIRSNTAFYYGNEKITQSNTGVTLNDGVVELHAVNGKYFFDEKKAVFSKDVVLIDTSNTLRSDHLTYFDKEDKAIAVGNVIISDSTSSISADSLIHFREIKHTFAFGNVEIVDTASSLRITGEELEDIDAENYTRIDGEPLLVQIDTTESGSLDTLIIRCKVMEAVEDSSRKLIATDSVKIIRGEFASVNHKSILYRDEDKIETIKPGEEQPAPILWYGESQVVGDTVFIYLDENVLKQIDINGNALIISINEDFEFRFDQVSGDKVKLFFENDELNKTEVFGKVLSIYYMYDEEEPNGLVKASSQRASIEFDEGRIVDVKLFGSPESEFHPENKIIGKEKDFILPTFILYDNRPQKEKILN
ncbi:MAG: OstA-like protein [Ignavibacteria bacterium]|jgi:lipopolysaccharide export system protein LptA